jgi:TldD protein
VAQTQYILAKRTAATLSTYRPLGEPAMPHIAATDVLFYEKTGLDRRSLQRIVDDALQGADDGELFIEYRQSEGLVFDDGRLKAASFDTAQGFGLRAIAGDAAGYAHASELSEDALGRAARTVRAVHDGHGGRLDVGPTKTNRVLYDDANPLNGVSFEAKVALLAEIDAFARAKDPRVQQVSVSLSGEWQALQILRPGGQRAADIRPLVRLNISLVLAEGERMESGSYGSGGRIGYETLIEPHRWQVGVEEALRRAIVNLGSVSGLIGEQVAAKGVTVVDNGTLADRRGSLTVDDEGTPSQATTLIEDGILVGYMQDRQNARLMGMKPTGNGRRQSFAHIPMPRMTNTFMLAGEREPEEILRAAKKGLYAVNFGGGQVDITSGKFVFSCTEAYLIEDGKIGPAVKGATLIGNGPDAMKKIMLVGNDLALDDGIGTCGKDGQGVPVGVGQPTMLIDRLTVGGTAA